MPKHMKRSQVAPPSEVVTEGRYMQGLAASILRNVMEILLAWAAETQCLATSAPLLASTRTEPRGSEMDVGPTNSLGPTTLRAPAKEEGDSVEGAGEIMLVHVRWDAIAPTS
jgi:hypothetical protein